MTNIYQDLWHAACRADIFPTLNLETSKMLYPVSSFWTSYHGYNIHSWQPAFLTSGSTSPILLTTISLPPTGFFSNRFTPLLGSLDLHWGVLGAIVVTQIIPGPSTRQANISSPLVAICCSSHAVVLALVVVHTKGPSEGMIQDLHYNGSGDAELIDCQKVSVIDFLEYLFGKTFWPRAVEGKTAFQHAYINFSHWVPMTEFISPRVPDQTDAISSSCIVLDALPKKGLCDTGIAQLLVDNMIPIYFDDPALGSEDINHISQMFISDKAGKNCNEQDLGFVTRKHDSIQCLSKLPYIALLLDLNVKSKLNVTFSMEPNHVETDRCLRNYAYGISETTFPFLRIVGELHGLVSQQKEVPSQTALEALVKFGSTARLRNLQWEAQDA
ncbi:hypothetical protein BDR05DRAFT_1012549 [Suillus weaverae]|nr:hypothetical protein BDR05DRAFT_1012549 [Suillus weaverae]